MNSRDASLIRWAITYGLGPGPSSYNDILNDGYAAEAFIVEPVYIDNGWAAQKGQCSRTDEWESFDGVFGPHQITKEGLARLKELGYVP